MTASLKAIPSVRPMRRFVELLPPCFLIVAVVLAGCGNQDTYRPVYYPDRNDLSVYARGPTFDNLAQAKQWAEDQHRQSQDPRWTYEIGKNCRPFENSDIEVCEETVR